MNFKVSAAAFAMGAVICLGAVGTAEAGKSSNSKSSSASFSVDTDKGTFSGTTGGKSTNTVEGSYTGHEQQRQLQPRQPDGHFFGDEERRRQL
jgi:lipid-binding SYLF domain-containing protein